MDPPFSYFTFSIHSGSSGLPQCSNRGAPGLEVPCSKALSTGEKQLATSPTKSPVGLGIQTSNLPITSSSVQPLGHHSRPTELLKPLQHWNCYCSQTHSATAIAKTTPRDDDGSSTANTTRTQSSVRDVWTRSGFCCIHNFV